MNIVVCAMLNSQDGGTVYVGVTKSGQLRGQNNVNKEEEIGWKEVHASQETCPKFVEQEGIDVNWRKPPTPCSLANRYSERRNMNVIDVVGPTRALSIWHFI